MDLALYLRVVWRFRFLIAAGVLVAVALAFLSHFRVGFEDGRPAVAYRAHATWASTATLLLTEEGFPWGASQLQDVTALQLGKPPSGPTYSDPGRFEQLVALYARFAQSDEVRARMAERGPVNGTYTAAPVKTEDGGPYLPLLSITALSNSPEDARRVAHGAATALRDYLAEAQQANEIPADRRVELQVVNSPSPATIQSGRSPVKPMFILLIGLALTLGLAFVLENLRPRAPETVAPSAELPPPAEVRRTARRA